MKLFKLKLQRHYMFCWLSCVDSICPTCLKFTRVKGFIVFLILPSFELPLSLQPFVLNFLVSVSEFHMGLTASKSSLADVLIMKTQNSVAAFLTHTL